MQLPRVVRVAESVRSGRPARHHSANQVGMPRRYLVPECITRSIPNSAGCWLIGVPNVGSTMLSNLCSLCNPRSIFRESTTRNVGFVGDSKYSCFVLAESPARAAHNPSYRQTSSRSPSSAATASEIYFHATINIALRHHMVATLQRPPIVVVINPMRRKSAPHPHLPVPQPVFPQPYSWDCRPRPESDRCVSPATALRYR